MTIIAFQSGEATYQRMIVLFHGRNTHPTAGLVLRSFADETPSVIQIAWLKSQGLALFKAHFPLNATCFGKKKTSKVTAIHMAAASRMPAVQPDG